MFCAFSSSSWSPSFSTSFSSSRSVSSWICFLNSSTLTWCAYFTRVTFSITAISIAFCSSALSIPSFSFFSFDLDFDLDLDLDFFFFLSLFLSFFFSLLLDFEESLSFYKETDSSSLPKIADEP